MEVNGWCSYEAYGDAGELVSALLESAEQLDIDAQIIPSEEWTYGEAKGVCKHRCLMTMRPRVEVKNRDNQADLAGTFIHEYAHALLHFEIDDRGERNAKSKQKPWPTSSGAISTWI